MGFARAHNARVWACVRVGARKGGDNGQRGVFRVIGRTRANARKRAIFERLRGRAGFESQKEKPHHEKGGGLSYLSEHYKRADYGYERADCGHYRCDDAAGVNCLARLCRYPVAGLLLP